MKTKFIETYKNLQDIKFFAEHGLYSHNDHWSDTAREEIGLSLEKLVDYAKDNITPIFIDAKIMPLIEDAYTGIKQMISDRSYKPRRIIFPARSGFLQFEKPIKLMIEGLPHPTKINKILYVTHTAHASMVFFDSAFEYPILKNVIAFDNLLIEGHLNLEVQRADTREIFDRNSSQHNFIDVISKMFAIFEFMNKNIVEINSIQPTTKELKTKQFKKLGKTFKTIPNVQVIRLRKKSIEYDYVQQQTNRTPLERTFSWVVRGHMRKQWFASIGEHQPVWIAPHIKGNINMPLQNSQKMFVVDR